MRPGRLLGAPSAVLALGVLFGGALKGVAAATLRGADGSLGWEMWCALARPLARAVRGWVWGRMATTVPVPGW